MADKGEKTAGGDAKSLDDLEAELAKLREDFSSLADTITDIASGEYRDAKDRIDGAAKQARRGAEEAVAQLRPAINKNPLTSLFVAFGIGFLIGAILRR